MASLAVKPQPNSWRALTGRRSFIPWYGGKVGRSNDIVGKMPVHRAYCEPCCGACNVLLSKDPVDYEAINDIDNRIVTTMEVIRDKPEELASALALTPYSRYEFERSRYLLNNASELTDVQVAVMFLTCVDQNIFAVPDLHGSWRVGRAGQINNMYKWRNLPDNVITLAKRLHDVFIDCKPACDFID